MKISVRGINGIVNNFDSIVGLTYIGYGEVVTVTLRDIVNLNLDPNEVRETTKWFSTDIKRLQKKYMKKIVVKVTDDLPF